MSIDETKLGGKKSEKEGQLDERVRESTPTGKTNERNHTPTESLHFLWDFSYQ